MLAFREAMANTRYHMFYNRARIAGASTAHANALRVGAFRTHVADVVPKIDHYYGACCNGLAPLVRLCLGRPFKR